MVKPRELCRGGQRKTLAVLRVHTGALRDSLFRLSRSHSTEDGERHVRGPLLFLSGYQETRFAFE